MPLPATDVERVKAAALKPAPSPSATRERQPTTTSFRMRLRACRRDRLLSPDPTKQPEEREDRSEADQCAAHLARVGVHEHVACNGNAEGDPTDLAVQPDRPRVTAR